MKILFGSTGEDYVLALDEDDGLQEWQTYDWNGNVPEDLCEEIDRVSADPAYITRMVFGPSGECYMSSKKRDGSGAYTWWGEVDTECSEAFRGQANNNLEVSFGCNSSWICTKDRNNYKMSRNTPSCLKERMWRIMEEGRLLKRVRLLPSNHPTNGSHPSYWISDSKGTLWSRNLDEKLSNYLKEGNDEVLDVAQAGDLSWVVIRPNRFEASG